MSPSAGPVHAGRRGHVAWRLVFDKGEALTLGQAVAGLNAQAKERKLGIFKPHYPTTAKPGSYFRGKAGTMHGPHSTIEGCTVLTNFSAELDFQIGPVLQVA